MTTEGRGRQEGDREAMLDISATRGDAGDQSNKRVHRHEREEAMLDIRATRETRDTRERRGEKRRQRGESEERRRTYARRLGVEKSRQMSMDMAC